MSDAAGAQIPVETTDPGWQAASRSTFALLNIGSCSTWKADKDSYLGASHCFEGTQESFLIDREGVRHRVGGDVWIDRAHDLALFKRAPGENMPDAPVLPMGNSQAIAPGDKLHLFGFDDKILLGTQLPFSTFNNPTLYSSTFEDRVPTQSTPDEGFAQVLMRRKKESGVDGTKDFYMRVNSIDVKGGTSGGAWISEQGTVVGIEDFGMTRGTMEFATPIEYAKDLVHNRDSYTHYSGSYLNGIQLGLRHLDLQARDFWPTATMDTIYGVGAWSGIDALRAKYPTLAPLASGVLAWQTYSDASNYMYSSTPQDKLVFGLMTATDLVASWGRVGMLNPWTGRTGKILFVAGVLGRLALELWPNHYVVETPIWN